jgi:hypothetical protein
LLEGIPQLVPNPTYGPALFVHVLFFHRQAADVADKIFAHYLPVFVQGDLDDVSGLVHRTLYCMARSVGVLVDHALGLGLVAATGSVCSVVRGYCRALGSLSTFVCLFGVLPGTVGFPERLANTLTSALASLLYGLTGARPDLLGSLTKPLTRVLDRLARICTYLLSSLADAFADLAYGATSALSDISYCLSCATTHVFDSLARALNSLSSSLSNLSDRLARSTTHVFDRGACTFANILDSLARTLDSLSSAGADVFDR